MSITSFALTFNNTTCRPLSVHSMLIFPRVSLYTRYERYKITSVCVCVCTCVCVCMCVVSVSDKRVDFIQ